MVEALANCSAGMNQGKLLIFIPGILDHRSLEGMENGAERGGGGGTLGVILIRLLINVLLEHNVCTLGQGRFQILSNGNDPNILLLADIQNGEEFAGLSAAGGKYHHVPGLEETGGTVHRFSGRDKPRRALNAAKQMGKMLADDAGMATSGGADPLGVTQKLHSLRIGGLVKDLVHFFKALGLGLEGFLGNLHHFGCYRHADNPLSIIQYHLETLPILYHGGRGIARAIFDLENKSKEKRKCIDN